MKLGYSYLLEYVSERFAVLFASKDGDSQYGMPVIYTKGTILEQGRIYIVAFEEDDIKPTTTDILVITCCDPTSALPKGQTPTKHAGLKSRNIYLNASQNDALHIYTCLVELFYQEAAWQEALWALFSNYESSSIQDYLNASVGMLGDALLYYPVGGSRTCLYATVKDWKSTALAGLLDEPGERYFEDADYRDFQAVVSSSVPNVVQTTNTFGNQIHILAISAWESKHSYAGMFMLPISSAQATHAQLWHISRLRDAWEMHLGTYVSVDRSEFVTKYGALRLLLTESSSNVQNLKKRLRSLGFSPETKYVCAVIRVFKDGAYEKIPLKQFCTAIESMRSDCYAIQHESHIVVVLETKSGDPLPESFFKKVLEGFKPVKAQAGVSFEFSDILLLRNYAKQAKAAFETGAEMRPNQPVYLFKDLAMYYILSHGTDELPARMLCAPGIIELQKRSDTGGIDYIDTLRTHMRNSRNASLTARELHIHRSTLQYRLERISEVTQMNLEDSDDRLYLELSLALLHQY